MLTVAAGLINIGGGLGKAGGRKVGGGMVMAGMPGMGPAREGKGLKENPKLPSAGGGSCE